MEMLGLLRCTGELSAIASASTRRAGSVTPRKSPKPPLVLTPLRRSGRLIAATTTTGRRFSARLNGQSVEHKALPYKGLGPPSCLRTPCFCHGPGRLALYEVRT